MCRNDGQIAGCLISDVENAALDYYYT